LTEDPGDSVGRGDTGLLADVEVFRGFGDADEVENDASESDTLGGEKVGRAKLPTEAVEGRFGKLANGWDGPTEGDVVTGDCELEIERNEELGLSARRDNWGEVAEAFRTGATPLVNGDAPILDVGDWDGECESLRWRSVVPPGGDMVVLLF
jgi:hypothetical protein